MAKKTDNKVNEYMYKKISGKEFCALFPDLSKRLVKLTNYEENHNGFKFETGLNEDTVPFDPTGICQPGGIYFTDIDNIARWLDYGYNSMSYCRTVTLPSDCRIYIEENKFKADKIILGERVEIKNLDCWSDNDFCLNAVKQNVKSLLYVIDINDEIQSTALKRNRVSIMYLNDRRIQLSEIFLTKIGFR